MLNGDPSLIMIRKCPYCNDIPTITVEKGTTTDRVTIMCANYHCNMLFSVHAMCSENAVTLWNELVEQEKAKQKGEGKGY